MTSMTLRVYILHAKIWLGYITKFNMFMFMHLDMSITNIVHSHFLNNIHI